MYLDGSSKFTTTSQEVTKQHSGGTDSLAVGNIVHRSSSQRTYVHYNAAVWLHLYS